MSNDYPKIETIVVRLAKNRTMELSVEEARQLHLQLKEFFDKRMSEPYPCYEYVTTYS